MFRMTLNCVRPTQFSVIQTINRNVGLKCFFVYLPKCLVLLLYIHILFIFHKRRDAFTVWWDIHCLKKKRNPATFCNNSNSAGSIAIDFDKNNR